MYIRNPSFVRNIIILARKNRNISPNMYMYARRAQMLREGCRLMMIIILLLFLEHSGYARGRSFFPSSPSSPIPSSFCALRTFLDRVVKDGCDGGGEDDEEEK
jgi:hypothetical protein